MTHPSQNKSKLFGYDVCGKTLRRIDSVLCYRTQQAVINGETSEWAPVLSGVLQGAILGSLFSLHINDISTDTDADDCVCYHEIRDTEDSFKLEKDIDRLGCWARKWGMIFQPVICNTMQITMSRTNGIETSLTLEGMVLRNADSIKYLGVSSNM